jgi:hypothetical protein
LINETIREDMIMAHNGSGNIPMNCVNKELYVGHGGSNAPLKQAQAEVQGNC